MRENICEDRRVIERNGFKKFSKKNQRRIVISLDAVSWNMMSKKHQNMLKVLASKSDASFSTFFCS
jgi:hypothetical protein